jgi:CRP/FNR family transcriptional regulator
MLCANRNCPFLQLQAEGIQLSESELQCIGNLAQQKVVFSQGEVLFLQGQPSKSLYSLMEGTVKICTNSADGREQIVGLSSPGNLLVGLQSINDTYHAYTAIAVTPVSACKISHRRLLGYVRTRGDIAMRLIQAANSQLAHSRALMEVTGHNCAAAKIASFILLMTPRSEHGNCGFAMPFSRLEMASILGLSEETVCRLMANLKRTGAINAPRGKIEIRDWSQLHAVAEGNAGKQQSHHLH